MCARVRVTGKPLGFHLRSAEKIATMPWQPLTAFAASTLVTEKPLSVANGSTVLFKDARLTETAAPIVTETDAATAAANARAVRSRYARDEVAFVIYSPEEQRRRDDERKAKADADKKEVNGLC